VSMDVPMEPVGDDEAPSAMEAALNSVAELVSDEELASAFVAAGTLTVTLEESGDVTVSAGDVSRTVPAAVAMGEAGEIDMEGEGE